MYIYTVYIQCIYNVYEKTWTEGCPALPGTNIPGGDSIFKTPVVNSSNDTETFTGHNQECADVFNIPPLGQYSTGPTDV